MDRRSSHPQTDVVVFDPAAIRDAATFENPNQLSVGMEYVLVNGVPVIDGGKMTQALPARCCGGPGSDRSDDYIGPGYDEFLKTRVIGATEFKAKCLALLDEIGEKGTTVTVTKRGRPVATIGPARTQTLKSPKGILSGTVKITGDIVHVDTSELWDALRRD